ncbi:hypothetical protein G4P54_02715 [Bacillus tequilensis]|uniref:Uncharacterized protein n=1 Tax=Bacillus tequilensis TaxID=227866 RepID=A0A6H0WF59_9BACI|nr:hypothetical protein G4P54_02715 [Bacillus tequilensis]
MSFEQLIGCFDELFNRAGYYFVVEMSLIEKLTPQQNSIFSPLHPLHIQKTFVDKNNKIIS